MAYQFIRQEPCYDHILIVLALDRDKMKERILIGTEQQIRFRLDGNKDNDVIYDITRPLGRFLIDFEYDKEKNWNIYGLAPLRDALHTNRWKQPALEQTAGDFLAKKYLTGDPVRMYATFRIWNEYLVTREYRDRNTACDRFIEKIQILTQAFQTENVMNFNSDTGKPERFHTGSLYFRNTPAEITRLELWFPDNRRRTECVAAYSSFYPQ